MNRNTCPICGEGTLHEVHHKNNSEYKNTSELIDLVFEVCDVCHVEQASDKHLRQNKRALIAFRKRVDGLLSGEQVRAIRTRLGLSQKQASEIFGGGPTAFSKYEKDDVAQAESMDMLLRMADAEPNLLQTLRRIASAKSSIDIDRLGYPLQEDWDRYILNTKEPAETEARKVVRTESMQIETDWHQYRMCA